jgi:ribosome-associated protein
MGAVDVVSVAGDGIRLGQFLKLAGLVDSGSDAKALLQAGEVQVNGEVDVRRGRHLDRGDVVQVGGQAVQVG